jgi:type I site-specific restriction-modification system R (restriction) subunit
MSSNTQLIKLNPALLSLIQEEPLLDKREFASLTEDEPTKNTKIIDKFSFKNYQLFVHAMMQYNTDRHRFLIKHGTGTGKTITALLIAKSFIDKG